ncbi:MAG TPA: 23S rRNA (adenine(2030)-N(6))-methyltransferase RlmJ [Rhizomicrobium sp.]|nr:23S rRNA (adenine(2030)-N(6))-methyltransferase RlmJ [Rhizomicrobium sp.]
MNYRHAFHAGNFADVVKHLALVSILIHLRKKEAPFAVIDTHAGRGLYDLSGEEAKRSGEAKNGIARVRDLDGGPGTLGEYLALVRDCGRDRYPGSPLIAAKLIRSQDRLVAIEKHPEDAAALEARLARFRKARIVEADGYARLPTLLPPQERRGLILIDPPYEAPDEFSRAAQAVGEIMRRFATGIVVVWFPIKSTAAANAFCGEVVQTGVRKLLRVDIEAGAMQERMAAAGLLVVNPPFGFAAGMRAALDAVAPRLGREQPAKSEVKWLAGSE